MNRRNYALFLVLAMFFLFSTATPVSAAKKRVWGKTIVTAPAKSGSLSISAKFSGWKQYLDVSFRGAKSTKGITYEIIYTSNGIDQGAGGSIATSQDSVTKSIFLGTCSHGACVAHKNISNVRLKVTYQSTSGQSVTKSYKVKY